MIENDHLQGWKGPKTLRKRKAIKDSSIVDEYILLKSYLAHF